jgi:hypothetical protein
MKINFQRVIARNEAISTTDIHYDKCLSFEILLYTSLLDLISLCRDCFVPRNDVFIINYESKRFRVRR